MEAIRAGFTLPVSGPRGWQVTLMNGITAGLGSEVLSSVALAKVPFFNNSAKTSSPAGDCLVTLLKIEVTKQFID